MLTVRLVQSLENFAKAIFRHPSMEQTAKVEAVASRVSLHVERYCTQFEGASYLSQLMGEKPIKGSNLAKGQVRSMPLGTAFAGEMETAIKVSAKAATDKGGPDGSCKNPVHMAFSVFQGAELFAVESANDDMKVNSRVIAAAIDGAQASNVELTFLPLTVRTC